MGKAISPTHMDNPYYSRTDTTHLNVSDAEWKRILPDSVYDVARNKAIDRYRQKSRVAENQTDYKVVHIGNEHFKSTTTNTDKIGLNTLIDKLKPDLKEMIELHYFKGYTHQEITDRMQLPLGTVKTRIRSAMKDLKQIVGIR